ncbi:MAG: DUF2007 domain-containing protein [Planctomycetaceae bacterium]|nr:DUF2007 domain-containing protein [Planctomycetaceae bacterium]
MKFAEPFKAYWAESNVEAHLVADLLASNGIESFVEEEHTATSLWVMGRISQFHQSNIWIDRSSAPAAAEVIREFEERKKNRASAGSSPTRVLATCDECGKVTAFPETMNGTVQNCPHCSAFLDVGEVSWDADFEDVGETDSSSSDAQT